MSLIRIPLYIIYHLTDELKSMTVKSKPTNLRVIKECREVLSTIPNINNGGCLIAAYSIFLYYKKYYPKLFKDSLVIVQLSKTPGDIVHNQMYLKNYYDSPCSSNHFGISFNGGKTYYDSEGLISVSEYSYKLIIPHKLTKEFTVKALKSSTWNSKFKRKKYVPKIESKLQITLKQIIK